jgi:pyruvate,water dikinase
MECEALKRVRDDMGLTNVEIMVPFVRTVKQAERVADAGRARPEARRGRHGLR